MPGVCKNQRYQKTESEVLLVRVDVSDMLRDGDTVSAISSTTITPSGELTAGSVAASGGALEINGVSVASGEAITFTASAGEADETYEVKILFTTTAGATLQVEGIVIVVRAD